MVLYVPGLQHAAGLGVVVGVNNHAWPSIGPLDGSRRTRARQEHRILGLRSSEPGGCCLVYKTKTQLSMHVHLLTHIHTAYDLVPHRT